MTTLIKRRPSLTDLIWSAWPDFGPLEVRSDDTMAMRMEEFVDEDTLVVRAEMPGVDPEKDVSITVEDGVLSITAERREETTEGEAGKAGYRSEFRYGSYRRSMTLPKDATADDVKATYTDGILEVRVPLRREQPVPQKIEVTRT